MSLEKKFSGGERRAVGELGEPHRRMFRQCRLLM